MKNLIAASLALGAALAFTPLALADSFAYSVADSSSIVKGAFNTQPRGMAKGVAENGDRSISEVSRDLAENGGLPIRFGREVSNRGSLGAGAGNSMLAGEGEFVELNGHQLDLISGSFNKGSRSIAMVGAAQFEYAGNGGLSFSNEIEKGKGHLLAAATNLTETPEPGSLFLLGTGLLGLALALFRKSAKRPSQS